jgi:uncharacterized protein RhaS with RHS repeats
MGLDYNWYRHYDPTIGRYAQPDPIEFVDGPSVYAYVRSAPTHGVDPLGLDSSEYSEECQLLLSQIYRKLTQLITEIQKYDPILDGIGGFPMKWGSGFTKPGGHYQEIRNLQRGIKNDITRYNKECRNHDDDDNGPGCPPIPRHVDDWANKLIPEPIFPTAPDAPPPGPSFSPPPIVPYIFSRIPIIP